MKYGNCLIGLMIIMFTAEEKGRIIVKKSDHCWIPHLLFQTKSKIYHYRVIKDVLPWPLCYLLFRGEFHTIG